MDRDSNSHVTIYATGTTSLLLMPHPLSVLVLPSGQRNEPEPLLPNLPIKSGVGCEGVVGGGASHRDSESQSNRKEIPCKYFLFGTCPYREECRFAHLEPVTQQQIGISRGVSLQQLESPSWGPLQVLSGGQRNKFKPPLLPNPPIPPLQAVVERVGGWNMVGAGAIHHGSGSQSSNNMRGQSPVLMFPRLTYPILKFNFLSKVTIEPVRENTTINMIARANHFYVTYGQMIFDYAILFGDKQLCQKKSVCCNRVRIAETVSCLYFSKQQPTLMVIGTVFGSIYMLDIRNWGMVTSAHKAEVG